MSATLAATRRRVQNLIGDRNPDRRSVNSIRLDEIIEKNVHLIAGRIILPREPVTTGVTLVAGTYDYSLTGEIALVSRVVDNTRGDELIFLDFDELNRRFEQDTSDPVESGTTGFWTTWEDSSQVTRLRIAPTPSAAGTLRVYHAVEPAALNVNTETTAIPFPRMLLRGLEAMCAAEAASLLSEDELAILKLSPGVVGIWNSQANQAIRDHNQRQLGKGRRQEGILRKTSRFGYWA